MFPCTFHSHCFACGVAAALLTVCVCARARVRSEMVALIGAHALGRCHTDRSGYNGPWTNAPTTFSNLYFQELLHNKW